MTRDDLLLIAEQFFAYEIQFSDEKEGFEIINPYGKDPISVEREGEHPDSSCIVCFTYYHTHLYDVEQVVAYVRDILEGKRLVIGFYKDGRWSGSADLDEQEQLDLSYMGLSKRMSKGPYSMGRPYDNHEELIDVADSFFVRGWAQGTDFDAVIVRDEQGNATVQKRLHDNWQEDVIAAHKYCIRNKNALAQSKSCGCFHCLAIFPPEDIHDWIIERSVSDKDSSRDNLSTARCPHCGIDSVIGDASGYPITKDFLAAMEKYWFNLLEN